MLIHAFTTTTTVSCIRMTIHHYIIPPHSDAYDTPTHPTVLPVMLMWMDSFSMSGRMSKLSDEVNLAILAQASDLSRTDDPHRWAVLPVLDGDAALAGPSLSVWPALRARHPHRVPCDPANRGAQMQLVCLRSEHPGVSRRLLLIVPCGQVLLWRSLLGRALPTFPADAVWVSSLSLDVA